MNKPSIPQIQTDRLLLRAIEESDLKMWVERIIADPDVMRFIPKRDLPPDERAWRAYTTFSEHWAERGYGVWALIDKDDGQFIGHGGLNYLDETGEVEVLYALAKSYWGRGLATEAAHVSLVYGFETSKLDRIIGLVMPENLASRRVLEKAGLVYLNEATYFDLKVDYFAVTREQYLKQTSHKQTLFK